jgi:primary-amine oxidase
MGLELPSELCNREHLSKLESAMAHPHPFDPITAWEIKAASAIIQQGLPDVSIRFRRIDLDEPAKALTIPFIEAERLSQALPAPPPRVAQVLFDDEDRGVLCKGKVDLRKQTILSVKELPKGTQVSYTTGT